MSIEKMNEHYSMTNPASVYDEEALTALELVGRIAAKVIEIVNDVNKFESHTDSTLESFMNNTIPNCVEDNMRIKINNGAFDNQINKYIGNLEQRVDNLTNSYIEGSTTMDAEIIDARIRPNGEVASNLREGNFFNYMESLSVRKTPAHLDANGLQEMGVWWVSSGSDWKNVPRNDETGAIIGGYLMTLQDTAYGAEMTPYTHTYQLFFGADGCMYFRLGKLTAPYYHEWDKINPERVTNAHINEVLSPIKNALEYNLQQRKKVPENITNIDDLRDNGLYFVGSSVNYDNLPDGENAGLLMSYQGFNAYTIYHIFFSYTGKLYIRNTNVDTTFKAWKRVAMSGESSGTSGSSVVVDTRKYEVVKGAGKDFDIYETLTNCLIKYEFKFVPCETGLHGEGELLRLYRIIKCDKDKTNESIISDVGHDCECVVKYDGGFYGGVHGCETGFSVYVDIDGQSYDVESLPDSIKCNAVIIGKMSQLELPNGYLDKQELIDFNNDGMTVSSCFTTAEGEFYETEIYGGMVSVYKTHVNRYMCAEYIFPRNIPESTEATDGEELTGHNCKTLTFTGKGLRVTHTVDEVNDMLGNTHNGGMVFDYGDRVKSYQIFTFRDSHVIKSNIKIEG